jgi:hypothetical protein
MTAIVSECKHLQRRTIMQMDAYAERISFAFIFTNAVIWRFDYTVNLSIIGNCSLVHAGSLLNLLLNPENGGNTILRNVS